MSKALIAHLASVAEDAKGSPRAALIVAGAKKQIEQLQAPNLDALELIESDRFALTFQSLGQYRKAIINVIRALRTAAS